jgi:predicted O-methyltransferase YrrM
MAQLPNPTEGFTTHQQRVDMYSLIKHYAPDTKTILEIGFNGGHSADSFLKYNTQAKLVSFDIGAHAYVKDGKEYVDQKYPGRHTLIIGDSTKTIPVYQADQPFDVIFIDGGHEYPIAKADLENCKRLAHKNTLVMVDDIVKRTDWVEYYNRGPNRAWEEAKKSGLIKEIDSEDYSHGRGMAWGRYN